jgi:hypothetical protein
MEDHETRRKIIRQWMALPKDKRQTADQAAAFAKRAVEQVSAQQPRAVRQNHGMAVVSRRQVVTGPPGRSDSSDLVPWHGALIFERYDFRVGGLSGRTVEIVSVQIGLARP